MAPDILPNTDISFELELMWVGIPVAVGETGMLAPAAAELERLRLVREERQGMQHRRACKRGCKAICGPEEGYIWKRNVVTTTS